VRQRRSIRAARKDGRAGAEERRGDALPFVPPTRDLRRLARASRLCRGCPLYRRATQTVFGEGRAKAPILLVGEQPGDREDREGRPFIGPAGAFLDASLEAAGIAREDVFVTNAVKHFKFEERGNRRIHKKPRVSEVSACLPWLDAEIRAVSPRVLVALGATAEIALRRRTAGAELPLVRTLHPAAVLRAPDRAGRHRLQANLVRDLREARRIASKGRSPSLVSGGRSLAATSLADSASG
jgi:uracil-DNA glycosylase family protein